MGERSGHIQILSSYAPSLLNFRGPLIRDLIAAGHRVSVGAGMRKGLVQREVAKP